MTGLLTPTTDPLRSRERLAAFLLHRMAAAVVVALLATAVVIVGVRSGGWEGTVSLEQRPPEAAEEPGDRDHDDPLNAAR